MNLEILQIALLTAFGKKFLYEKKSTLDIPLPEIINNENIKFLQNADEKSVKKGEFLADDSFVWYKLLSEKKVNQLFLSDIPLKPLQIFAQTSSLSISRGENWFIFAQKGSKCDVWGRKIISHVDKKVFYYYLIAENFPMEELKYPSLETTKLYLQEILSDLIEFTEKSELFSWKSIFVEALDCLHNKNQVDSFAEKILPKNCYSIEAKQVFSTCEKAWVFRENDSWKDVTKVYDYDLYQRLTANLFDTLCLSIVVAINSFQ